MIINGNVLLLVSLVTPLDDLRCTELLVHQYSAHLPSVRCSKAQALAGASAFLIALALGSTLATFAASRHPGPSSTAGVVANVVTCGDWW